MNKKMRELQAAIDAAHTEAKGYMEGEAKHAAALTALEAVRHAIAALDAGYPIDLCCTDAEDAMSALHELDGRSVSEDIVSQIFSHFCVGK